MCILFKIATFQQSPCWNIWKYSAKYHTLRSHGTNTIYKVQWSYIDIYYV